MKRVVPAILLGLLAGAAVAQTPAPEATSGPQIELSATEWDFGTKWYGEKCETELFIKNVGDAPLKIVSLKSSCGCTVAKPVNGTTWNGRVVGPGESEPLRLSYNTKKVRAKVSQTVTINTNDPKNPTIAIQVKGGIKQLFEMSPNPRITFTGLEKGSSASKELMLTSNIDEKVKLTVDEAAARGSEAFNVQLEELDEGKKYKLTVMTRPGELKLGSNATTVTLKTDNERFPTMQVPVSAYVAPRVQTSPLTLYVPRKGSTPIQRYIRVRYQTSAPIKVTGIETSHESVKAEVMPPRTNVSPQASLAMHEIRATLPPASEFPADGATITIMTDDKEEEYQKFVVRVVLQPEPRNAAAKRVRPNAPKPKPTPASGGDD